MSRTVEMSGRSVEEAIESALSALGVEREDVEIEVLDEGSKGLLGLVARKEAKVRVTETGEEKSEVVRNLVESVARWMGAVNVSTSVAEDEMGIRVDILGDDVGALIGKHGQTLDAMQFLANIIANRVAKDRVPIIVDVDGYKKRRESVLRKLAEQAAERVLRYGGSVRLEAMTPYERRIVHVALQGYDGVTTESEGDEPFRRVVVACA